MGSQGSGPTTAERRVRILRVIARMNMGGPAYQVALLSGQLDPSRYETLLVHGELGNGEASLANLAEQSGAEVRRVTSLSPEMSPRHDHQALTSLRALVRRYRPDIVHTHTAKAGALGRFAAVTSGRPRPIIVHTYHGHVLEGYFGPAKTVVYRGLERLLARASNRLICVTQANVEDLVRLRVAPRSKFQVVPLGLDLHEFGRVEPEAVAQFRREVGAAADDVLVVYVGRLVRVKRVDVLLRGVKRAMQQGAKMRLVIVGDGELRRDLEPLAGQLGLNAAANFLGYRTDVATIAAASDIAVVTSDSEGTPVSLIQAAAARTPLVATAVGGVKDVVLSDTGLLVPRRDEAALAEALTLLASDPQLRARMGVRAQEHVLASFSSERLVANITSLYEELLSSREERTRANGSAASSGP